MVVALTFKPTRPAGRDLVAAWANVGHDPVMDGASGSGLPAFEDLVDDLGLVRAKGLVHLRSLPLHGLEQATHLLGLASVTGRSPSAIETLLRQAVGGLGGGQLGSAAEYSFGLVPGTRDWPAQDRRAHAARIYGVSVERFRKHHELVIIKQVAEQIVAMGEAETRKGRRVQGFHGTSASAAQAIVEDGFKISRNKFDWLGDGAYFFQDSRSRAKQWAQKSYSGEWAVVKAEIDLDGCMDLLDQSWFRVLNEAYDAYLQKRREFGLRLPRQSGLAHGQDRDVINLAVGILASRGVNIRSIRAVFQEGRPAFPGSALFDLAHIQIAVRDLTALHNIGLVLEGDGNS